LPRAVAPDVERQARPGPDGEGERALKVCLGTSGRRSPGATSIVPGSARAGVVAAVAGAVHALAAHDGWLKRMPSTWSERPCGVPGRGDAV
jgi:hypothetical protein